MESHYDSQANVSISRGKYMAAAAARAAAGRRQGGGSKGGNLMGAISRLLAPGGVLFGTAPDGDAIVAATGSAKELRLSPPDHPAALLLQLLSKEAHAYGSAAEGVAVEERGQPLIFSLEDTVTSGTDASGCIEYLCHRAALARSAAAHGMEVVELTSLADSPDDTRSRSR